MIRGTTPRLEFTLPFSTDLLVEAFVTISQDGKVVLDKPMQDCNCEAEKLTVRLTQEETLELSCDYETEIQIRARTKAGDVFASDVFVVDTDRILKEGVI